MDQSVAGAPPVSVRIAMIVWNTFDSDARVQKEIATLNAAGFVVHVFCRRGDRDGPATEKRGPMLVVKRFPRKPGRDALGAADFVAASPRRSRIGQLWHMARQVLVQQQMVREMVSLRPHVVHAHDVNTLVPALQAARRARVPLIYDAHEFNMDRVDQHTWLRPVFRRIEAFALARAAGVIVPTPGIAKAMARFYKVSRPVVLGNWPVLRDCLNPAVPGLHASVGIPEERVIGLYQGGLQPHRGLELLMAAAAEVPELDLVLMGDGRLNAALKQQIAQLGLGDRVHLIPPQPLDRLLSLTMTADFGVHPLEGTCLNHRYASPNKLFEYLHAGLPVVVSDLPGMRRALKGAPGGDPALSFVSGDRAGLAQALRRLATGPALRAKLAARARAASEVYCWQAQEDVLRALYARVLRPISAPAGTTLPRP